ETRLAELTTERATELETSTAALRAGIARVEERIDAVASDQLEARERPVRPDLTADAPEFDIPPRRDRPADPAEELTRRLPPADPSSEEEPPTRRLFEDPARRDDDRPHPDQLGFDDEPTRRLP
ncbi:MAG: hypothetical protein AVDCRST_MAG85-382, partial [uncultured Solirubrobacteraceae bacterium]